MIWTRRRLLKNVMASSLALPFFELGLGVKSSWASEPQARRLIIFYFPDGVPGFSENGDPSLWHAQGEARDFVLPQCLAPLNPWRDQCIFLNGLTMGEYDTGSHSGGVKKLLTGVDEGQGESIDHYLARTAGKLSPHRHLYLGAMAQQNQASGDRFISYSGPGHTQAPEDHPLHAFERLFGSLPSSSASSSAPSENESASLAERRSLALKQSVIDGALEDLHTLQSKLGSLEQRKLNHHLEALRELELRIYTQTLHASERSSTPSSSPQRESISCTSPSLDITGVSTPNLYNASFFPDLLRTQTDLMVMAMACGLSQVGVIQSSHYISELLMSRFPNTSFSNPNVEMRSHQASHYGISHNWQSPEFSAYVQQRTWFANQFAYLLERLASQPEGEGSMLDYSLVLLCTEISDGHLHTHNHMPFVLAGGAGGRVSTGRVLNTGSTRHSHLLTSIAHAMGEFIPAFGQECTGPLSGLLT